MALPTSLGQRALQSLNRPSALQFIGTPQMGAPATQPVPQNIMGLRQKVLEQQMRPQMTPAQQFAQMTAGLPAMERTPSPDRPKGIGGLLSGMMPEAGTPEMAGIGAAGQKLLELSGYRQVPITTAEALGQAAGAFTQARGAALQQQREEAAAQAAAERQAILDKQAREKDLFDRTMREQEFALKQRKQTFEEEKATKPQTSKLPTIGSTRQRRLDSGMIQDQQWDGENYVDFGRPYSADSPKTPTFGAVRVVRTDDGMFQQQVWDGKKYVNQGAPYSSDKTTNTFKQVTDKEGNNLGSFRADDPRLKKYEGNPDYQIISKVATGTIEEVIGKPTKTKLEDKVVAAKGTLAGLESAMKAYDPNLLTVQGSLYGAIGNIKDRYGKASKEEQDFIKRQSNLQRRAFESLNQYIKDITGAQMSAAEYDRLALAFPTAPKGLFSTILGKGDSPTQFASKLADVYQSTKMSLARYQYALKNGLEIQVDEDDNVTGFLDKDGIPISIFAEDTNSMQSIMGRRAVEIESELIQAGLEGVDVEIELASRMRKEFGV